MYQKIVLAYDGSVEGRVALREGALLAKEVGAQVFLLAVTPQPVPDVTGMGVFGLDRHDEVFREGLAKAKEIGLCVVGEIVSGDPGEQISAFAKRVKADLVVVGHRNRSFVERWWSGPNQAVLIDKLDCSLLIARNNASDSQPQASSRLDLGPIS